MNSLEYIIASALIVLVLWALAALPQTRGRRPK
jgi:hypothetical protein